MIKSQSSIKNILYACFKYLASRFKRRQKGHLNYSIWGLNVNERGHLVVGGCDCVDLVREYGTPLHVVDKSLLQKNYNEFHESLKSHNIDFEIYYSYKTNPVPGIIQVLHECGAGAEVISPYELWLAVKLGVSPDLILYNGPNKPDEGLKFAIEKKIKMVNINSFSEIEKIIRISKKLGLRPKVGVRICPNIGWGSQFGFKIKSGEAYKAFEELSKSDWLEIVGIHVHLGSGIKNTSVYEIAIRNIFTLISEIKDRLGVCLKYLNLGGGFGVSTVKVFDRIESRLNHIFNIPYRPPDITRTPSIREFVSKIVTKVQEECEKYGLKSPVLLFEPGRAITSNTQILLARVGDLKKESNGSKIAILDAGINIAYPTSWEYHEIFLANKMSSNRDEVYSVAGPICTPSDLLYKSKRLPLLNLGDIVSIMDSGAYFISFSNNFSFPRPAVIMVSEGKHYVVREKENYEDMISLDNF